MATDNASAYNALSPCTVALSLSPPDYLSVYAHLSSDTMKKQGNQGRIQKSALRAAVQSPLLSPPLISPFH